MPKPLKPLAILNLSRVRFGEQQIPALSPLVRKADKCWVPTPGSERQARPSSAPNGWLRKLVRTDLPPRSARVPSPSRFWTEKYVNNQFRVFEDLWVRPLSGEQPALRGRLFTT